MLVLVLLLCWSGHAAGCCTDPAVRCCCWLVLMQSVGLLTMQ